MLTIEIRGDRAEGKTTAAIQAANALRAHGFTVAVADPANPEFGGNPEKAKQKLAGQKHPVLIAVYQTQHVDVGELPPKEALMYLDRIRASFEKQLGE